MTSLFYLASPYAHEDGRTRLMRACMATMVASKLAAAGIPVYSPIAGSHQVNQLCRNELGWSYWKKVDAPILLRACSALIVLMLPGWEESEGVREEIALAHNHGLTIHYCGFDDADIAELIERLLR